ncbi:Disease resistance gene analog PIC12 [Echinococcus multilocularis]|uniref:Disease resistance gene analog PIC12 n=1 Tax=Echinococcus multilocularis TaxID=6211 RepID=A0A0S4MQ33_ECHMU|nr:Disease resistance gene analog PIC12 [Echinococcus multilocularis]
MKCLGIVRWATIRELYPRNGGVDTDEFDLSGKCNALILLADVIENHEIVADNAPDLFCSLSTIENFFVLIYTELNDLDSSFNETSSYLRTA